MAALPGPIAGSVPPGPMAAPPMAAPLLRGAALAPLLGGALAAPSSLPAMQPHSPPALLQTRVDGQQLPPGLPVPVGPKAATAAGSTKAESKRNRHLVLLLMRVAATAATRVCPPRHARTRARAHAHAHVAHGRRAIQVDTAGQARPRRRRKLPPMRACAFVRLRV